MIEGWHRFGPFAKIFLAAMARYAPHTCAPAFAAGSCIRCTRAGFFGGGIAATLLHWLEKPVLPPPETATGDVA